VNASLPEPAKRAGTWSPRLERASSYAALALVWLLMRRPFLASTDLGLHDETTYLARGLLLLRHGQLATSLESSPLYAVWYALFHLVVSDPVVVYFAQWLATDALLVALVYALLRQVGCGRPASVAAAAYWTSLAVTTLGWPRVEHFAFFVVLGFSLLEKKTRKPWGIAGLALAALVRPEYGISALLGVLLLLTKRVWPSASFWMRFVVSGAFVVALGVGYAVTFGGGGRLWLAFEQHYALRYAAEHPGVTSDAWVESARITGSIFPGASSLGQAIRVNPVAFFGHVAHNLGRIPFMLAAEAWKTPWLGVMGPLAVGATVFGLVWTRWKRPAALGWDRSAIEGMRTPLLATAATLPSFVVATKAVYSLPLLFLGVASFARVWDVTLGGLVASAAPARLRRGVLGLYATLVLISAALTSAPVRARPVLDATAALRGIWQRMPPGAEWRLFDPVGGLCTYVDVDRCRGFMHYDKAPSQSFAGYLEEHSMNVVVLAASAFGREDYANDATLLRMSEHPEELRFSGVWASDVIGVYLRAGAARVR